MEKITLNKYRTIDNGSLRLSDAGKVVKLAGWVDTIRKLGELTFVVLRDSYGKTQVVLIKEFIINLENFHLKINRNNIKGINKKDKQKRS